MVYTGPSDGCHLCRKRRIKCDGGRPGCQRCAIYKAKCPGYRRESDFKFVNESASASDSRGPLRAKTSPGASSSKLSPSDTTSASTAGPPNLTLRTQSTASEPTHPVWTVAQSTHPPVDTPMMTQPSSNWEEWSVQSFLHDWTLPESTTGFGVGFLDFLPELSAQSSPDLDVSQALRAASFAMFANRHASQQMMASARHAYGRALTALNISLRTPQEAVKDSTITAIILLQIFEHITCDDTLSLGNHDAGLRMLLDMRGEKQMDDPRGRSIARIVFGYLFSRNVNQKRETCNVMKRSAHKLGYPAEHPARQRRPGSSGMPEVLRDLGPILAQNPSDPRVQAEAIQLMQSAVEFDLAYDRWQAMISPGWQPETVFLPPDTIPAEASSIPRSGVVHMYQSPLHACYATIWRMQYVVLHKRLIVTARHLGINDWSLPPSDALPAGYHESIAHSTAIIQSRIHEVLSCAACAMGELSPTGTPAASPRGRAVGAYYLLWPLSSIVHDEYASPAQQDDAKRALSYIGHVLGVARALRTPNRPLRLGNSPRSEWDNPNYRRSSPSETSSSSGLPHSVSAPASPNMGVPQLQVSNSAPGVLENRP